MIQRKGWGKDTGWKNENESPNYWVGMLLMDSRSSVPGPIICQKCFGLTAKGNSRRNLPVGGILECIL